jgi:hypothetical protein
MSPDETKRLLAVAQNLKVRMLLSLGYGCGRRNSPNVWTPTGSVEPLNVCE